jgi:uncharacterized protein with NRDE domain
MCLLVLAWQAHPRYALVVAANRDEYHERPAAALAKWPEPPGILAGRDLRAGGAWLALDRQRRFAVVTNFRELQRAQPAAPSRGGLVPSYLSGSDSAAEFFARLEQRADQYAGFNLLATDRDSLWYGCNRALPFARALAPGVYGLSNEFLDTPWPKLERVKLGFGAWLADPAGSAAGLFALLADRTQAPTGASPPARGALPREWERTLSAPFVVNATYGTRCSTVVLLTGDGGLQLTERRFDSAGEPLGETELRLNPGAWP